MMTSKERAALRAQANPLEVTLIVGKSGISQTLLDEAVILLDSHELVKGRVLETAGLTAREASDALCEALGAEGIACVGTKFVIWRKSEKLAQEKKKAAARKPAKKKPSGNDNPVKAGRRARKQAAEQQRKQRNDDDRPDHTQDQRQRRVLHVRNAHDRAVGQAVGGIKLALHERRGVAHALAVAGFQRLLHLFAVGVVFHARLLRPAVV